VNLAALLAAGAAAVRIPPGPGSLPDFIGHSAQPQPIAAPEPPRHPHMAPNGRSSVGSSPGATASRLPAGLQPRRARGGRASRCALPACAADACA
jgi:hypothetical protein